MKYAGIVLGLLSVVAVYSVGDVMTFQTTPSTSEITWNNIGNVVYGAAVPGTGYSTPTNPTGLSITTGYDRYARIGSTSSQFGKMSLAAGTENDTVMVSLEFANTTSIATTAGIGTSVGIAKGSMNLYGSNSVKVGFVNSGTSARYGRLMYSNTGTTSYLDFTGRSSANDITLLSGKWYKIVGYFTKTTTDNLWDITVQLWNMTDSVKVDEISQTGVLQENVYDGGDVVAGFSINRSSAQYSENLTWGISQIPEPSTMVLSATGVAMAAFFKRRK